MRAAARLDRRHLLRHPQVADVEDADPAEALLALRLGDTLDAAVEPAPVLLDRHEQKIPVDGNVSLPSGTDDGAEKLRIPRVFDVERVEPVVAPLNHDVFPEGEVRVREAQEAGPLHGVCLRPSCP